ncbi:MAG: DUF4338 domain-containing protein [Clostridiales bacterium]|nr:DUF4338 domain-containing protein [Clostridiales bacterium]
MDDTIRVFSGRTFSPKDIELIQWVRKTYPKLSRSELAATICESLDWVTPAGRPKLQQCIAFLDELESEQIIKLPPKQVNMIRSGLPGKAVMEFDTNEISGEIKDYLPIELTIANTAKDQKRWRSYVDQYHMLGCQRAFGSRLRYFIRSGEKELGCLQFSASSWALEERENWIGWSMEDKKERLHLIVNNSRYLIFPWVKIKNLASKALSLVARQIQDDWLREFCYAPVLMETFVDREHFHGTCYKAANWTHLGQTKGLGRASRSKRPSLSKKDIYVYPLQKDFRACLKGEKPYKVVNPDER